MSKKDSLVRSLSRFVDGYWGLINDSGGSDLDPVWHTRAWVDQFPVTSRVPLLEAMTTTLERTFVWKEDVDDYFTGLVSKPDFWRNSHICRGAMRGESHDLATDVVIGAIQQKLGPKALTGERTQWHTASNHVFVDDAIYSGTRVIEDYGQWWNSAEVIARTPQAGPLNVYFWTYILHQTGKENIERWINSNLRTHGYNVNVRFVSSRIYEDRTPYRDHSDVLWPSEMTERAGQSRLHLANRHDLLRRAGAGASTVFRDERQRRILESELLDASIDISKGLERPWTPLGYGRKPFGFGSLAVSYRNCPNNSPLALWWSLPGWDALFPRVTYAQREGYAADPYADVPF
jgi:hypothetical protein